jgi:uncharacterized protein
VEETLDPLVAGGQFERRSRSPACHIVDLPEPAAARAFAFDEPGYQAGVYRDVLLRRWRNMLGNASIEVHHWQFGGQPS